MPMPGILIIAHAPLASALKAVAGHIEPDSRRTLEVLDVPPDMPIEEVEAQARVLLQRVRSPEALILTDVFGGSPCNVAQRLVENTSPQVRAIAGVNVPMLWRALNYAEESLETLVSFAMARATQGVMLVSTSPPQNQNFKPGANDQERRHHQQ
jgi:mannose PTS system EIIA component